MPLIKTRNDIGASASIFPLQGNQFEYLPYDALVEIALLADAGDNINGTVFSGADLLMQGSRIDELAVANPIVYPDHYSLEDEAFAGDRLGVELAEVAGLASTARTAVKITPM